MNEPKRKTLSAKQKLFELTLKYLFFFKEFMLQNAKYFARLVRLG